MERSDRLALTYVMAAQAQKHVTVNETTRAIDALLHMTVRSQSIPAEPANPIAGDGYILPVGKTGAVWAGFADHAVAMFQDNAWMEYPPVEGMTVYVADTSSHVVWDGTTWTGVTAGATTTAPQFGVNASADPVNKLAVKSDAVLFTHDDVTPGSGDMRAVLNKAGASDTASVLFQNGFSARAEFGLTGSDDFVIKVSPDGQSFFDALVVDRTTGAVRFPNTVAFVGGGTPAFAPTDLSGLVAWWDPSDAGTVSISSGSSVASIASKSGGAVPAAQSQTSLQPTLLANGIGNRSVLSFGGGTYLDASGAASAFSGDDRPYSVHFVFESAQTAATQIPFGIGNSANTGQGGWFGVHSLGRFRVSKRSGSSADIDATETDTAGHLVSIIHDGTSTTIWIDGIRVVTDQAQNVPSMTIDRVSLGAWLRDTAAFAFDGKIGEVLIFDRAVTDAETRQIQRYLGDRWFNFPASADLFIAMGQSNMMGKGDAAASPTVPTGRGFEWTSTDTFQVIADPVGPADTGSCLPAFANAWHSATGRAAFTVNAALGSTSLLPEADAGFGNWNKTSGSLYNTAITAGNSAIARLQSNTIFTVGGVYALWAQGERDADNLANGTAGVTAANYQAALTTLISDTQADLSAPLGGFFIFELGARLDGSQEASWAAIRGAQGAAANAAPIAHVVFTDTKTFPANGLMADSVHYTQAGYDQMGTTGGTVAAGIVA